MDEWVNERRQLITDTLGGGEHSHWRYDAGDRANRDTMCDWLHDVLAVLTPIWHTKSATAKKVRQRIGAVMKWAIAQGHRRDNPAGEEIKAALPKGNGRVHHHRALPHDRVAEVLSKTRRNTNGLALRFVALTACRVGEVAEATWSEIEGDTVFRCRRPPCGCCPKRSPIRRSSSPDGGGKPIARQSIGRALEGPRATPHGFRSSFRNWCAETGVPREVAEGGARPCRLEQGRGRVQQDRPAGAPPRGHGGVGAVRVVRWRRLHARRARFRSIRGLFGQPTGRRMASDRRSPASS